MAASTTPGTCVLIPALARGRRVEEGPNIKRRCATGAGAASSASAAASRSSSSPRNWRTSWRAEGCGCELAAGVPAAAFFAGIAYIYERLAFPGPRALKGSSQLLLQPIGARASERPCSNECPSTLALELCETAEEASLRLLAEFRRGTAENPNGEKRDLSVQIDSEAASLPICIEKALRQPCRPLECFSDDGGSSSH